MCICIILFTSGVAKGRRFYSLEVWRYNLDVALSSLMWILIGETVSESTAVGTEDNIRQSSLDYYAHFPARLHWCVFRLRIHFLTLVAFAHGVTSQKTFAALWEADVWTRIVNCFNIWDLMRGFYSDSFICSPRKHFFCYVRFPFSVFPFHQKNV